MSISSHLLLAWSFQFPRSRKRASAAIASPGTEQGGTDHRKKSSQIERYLWSPDLSKNLDY